MIFRKSILKIKLLYSVLLLDFTATSPQKDFYSFIFKYDNYHIFNPMNKTNNNYLVLLQSIDLIKLNFDKKMNVSYSDDIGIPLQEKVNTDDLSIKDIYNK